MKKLKKKIKCARTSNTTVCVRAWVSLHNNAWFRAAFMLTWLFSCQRQHACNMQTPIRYAFMPNAACIPTSFGFFPITDFSLCYFLFSFDCGAASAKRTRRQNHWCSSCNSCNISCMYVIIFACNHVWVAYDRLLTAVNQNRHCWLQLFSRNFLEFISSQGDFQGYIYILATQMTDNCCDTRAT